MSVFESYQEIGRVVVLLVMFGKIDTEEAISYMHEKFEILSMQ